MTLVPENWEVVFRGKSGRNVVMRSPSGDVAFECVGHMELVKELTEEIERLRQQISPRPANGKRGE